MKLPFIVTSWSRSKNVCTSISTCGYTVLERREEATEVTKYSNLFDKSGDCFIWVTFTGHTGETMRIKDFFLKEKFVRKSIILCNFLTVERSPAAHHQYLLFSGLLTRGSKM